MHSHHNGTDRLPAPIGIPRPEDGYGKIADMGNPTFSRRQVLAGGMAGAAALGMAKVEHVRATGAESVRLASETKPAGKGSLADVKHVVFLMQENRSFDHYFGTMKGVAGFDDKKNRSAFTQKWPGGPQPSLAPLPHEHAK